INNSTPNLDFISFCTYHSENGNYRPNTLKAHKTAIKKLKEFRKEIPFSMLSLEFFEKYRKFLLDKKGNKHPTCFTDFKIIKKFINLADDHGIKLPFNKNKFIVVEPKTIPVFLTSEEMETLVEYFFNKYISPAHVLPLGYFLFCCYTGMRISDVQKMQRKDLEKDVFSFSHVKTENFQQMKIHDELREILNHCPELFINRLSDQKINSHLKFIAKVCKIEKNITAHVGRHTFATSILINDGNVAKLQKLLGHSKISNTMRYTHLIDTDVMDEVDKISFIKKSSQL
ncbi:MAG: site-specific integrase, partial [Chryseobacterium sp.]